MEKSEIKIVMKDNQTLPKVKEGGSWIGGGILLIVFGFISSAHHAAPLAGFFWFLGGLFFLVGLFQKVKE